MPSLSLLCPGATVGRWGRELSLLPGLAAFGAVLQPEPGGRWLVRTETLIFVAA